MESQRESCKDDGFTLIKIILVLTVAAILAAVLIPSVTKQVILDEFIGQYQRNVCSAGGEIKYVDGEMTYSVQKEAGRDVSRDVIFYMRT